jgi:hypothetical protein
VAGEWASLAPQIILQDLPAHNGNNNTSVWAHADASVWRVSTIMMPCAETVVVMVVVVVVSLTTTAPGTSGEVATIVVRTQSSFCEGAKTATSTSSTTTHPFVLCLCAHSHLIIFLLPPQDDRDGSEIAMSAMVAASSSIDKLRDVKKTLSVSRTHTHTLVHPFASLLHAHHPFLPLSWHAITRIKRRVLRCTTKYYLAVNLSLSKPRFATASGWSTSRLCVACTLNSLLFSRQLRGQIDP